MGLLRKFAHKSRFAAASGYALLPVQGVSRPVFILGCGRSGTTIFGTALSKHKSITYLNEPRHLWFAAYPETDIWTARAAKRQGQLVLTAEDANQQKSEKLRRLFRFETLVTNRPLLVEKLPINSFRLSFLHEIFPDARFIHIHRNAMEVARSIATQCESGLWFASHAYKWNELVRYAQARGETSTLPALCSNFFQMGLLEWRLSTEAIVKFLRDLREERYFEISYEQFIQDPVSVLEQVFAFLQIGHDSDAEEFVRHVINRRTGKIIGSAVSEQESRIAGPLLPFSIDGENQLTSRAADRLYFDNRQKAA
jgi:hypothetical protein